MKKPVFYMFCLGMLVLLWLCYWLLARPQIALFLEGAEIPLLELLLEQFYPRFLVERERFDPAFFLSKADQVLYRFTLLSIVGLWLFGMGKAPSKSLDQLGSKTLKLSLQLFIGFFLLYNIDLYPQLAGKAQWAMFYEPLGLMRLAGGWPPDWLCLLVLAVFYLTGGALAFGRFSPFLAWPMLLSFVLLYGWLQGFEKVNHGYAPHLLLLGAFCVLLTIKPFKKWGVLQRTLLQAMVLLPYTMAALEKLLTSGFTWVNPQTLATYLSLHPNAYGLWLADQPLLSATGMALALVFQLSSLLALRRGLALPYFGMALLFHASIYLFMGVGWWLHPWLSAWWLIIGPALLPRLLGTSKFLEPDSKSN